MNEENLRRMDERIEKMNEASLKRIEGKREKFNKEIMETFEGKFENANTLSPKVDKYKEETNKEMEMCLKNMNETLNSTSKGIIVSPNTEESSKETAIREDQNAWLTENKNRKNKEKIQTMEENIKKIRKIWRKKIVNTKEEMDMRKGGLISAFNIPINERRELRKDMNYRRNFIKMAKVNHHNIIKKNINKFKYIDDQRVSDHINYIFDTE